MSSRIRHDRPRGIALLLVLGLLAVSVTAAATLARLSTTKRLTDTQNDRLVQIDDILDPAMNIIDLWLASRADNIILPADAVAPRVEVASDALELNATTCTVAITAFDQQGMLPLALSQPGSPLREVVPSEMRDALDVLRQHDNTTIPGLDLLASSQSPHLSVYPNPNTAQSPSLGALLATHNPLPAELLPNQRSGNTSPTINVCTAPAPLLESALRAAGRGGLEAILQARSDNRSPPLPPTSPPVSSGVSATDHPARIGFTGRSDVWSFRVDISIDRTQKSWWLVYTRAANTPASSRSSWSLVQSHVITG